MNAKHRHSRDAVWMGADCGAGFQPASSSHDADSVRVRDGRLEACTTSRRFVRALVVCAAVCLALPAAAQIAVVAVDPNNISEIDQATIDSWNDPDFFRLVEVGTVGLDGSTILLQDAIDSAAGLNPPALPSGGPVNEVWIVKKDGRQPWREPLVLDDRHGSLYVRGFPFENPLAVRVEGPGGAAGMPAIDVIGENATPRIEGLSLASLSTSPPESAIDRTLTPIPAGLCFENSIPSTLPSSVTDTVTASVAVPAGGTGIAEFELVSASNTDDIYLTLSITASNLAELELQLISPSGTQVLLANIGTLAGTSMTNTTFDDFAPQSIVGGSAPYTGRFTPEPPVGDRMDKVAGEPINGTWRLVVNNVGAGNASIESASIAVTAQGDEPEYDVTVTIPVTDPTVYDVNVRLSMTDDDLSNVALFLRSPEGTVAQLMRRGDVVGDTMTNTRFDDEAAGTIGGSSPYTGRFRPSVDALSLFNGEDANGDWHLIVLDGVGDAPEVLFAELCFGSVPATAPALSVGQAMRVGKVTVEVRLESIALEDTEVILEGPNGTSVVLARGPAVDGFFLGSSAGPAIFDDDAEFALTPGGSPYSGTFRPVQPLAVFRGLNIAETDEWTLRVVHSGPAVTGRLVEWAINVAAEDPGPVAVRVSGSAPTINRCYIHRATNAGIQVISNMGGDPPSTPGRVTNSVIAENEGDGVRIEDDMVFDVLYSSVLSNDGDGVKTMNTARSFVANSLIYLNVHGLVALDSSVINTSTNYVYENGNASPPEDFMAPTDNYVGNVNFSTDSTDLFDLIDPAANEPQVALTTSGDTFAGKIRDSDSPLIDNAGTPSPTTDPILALDFESDVRSGLSGVNEADIGADEFSVTLPGLLWTFCEISTQTEGVTQYIGALPPRDLRIEIIFEGIGGNFDFAPFILPQGELAVENVFENRILLDPVLITDRGRRSIWTNRDTIQTLLLDRTPVGVLSADDVIADGHGAVVIGINPGPNETFLGVTYTDLTDGGQITGQALQGRHVIIDTIPPVLSFDLYTPPVRASAFVSPFDTNDVLFANGTIGSFPHPYPALPNLVDGQQWLPANFPVPEDGGGIGYGPGASTGQGASIFFNVASVSNIWPNIMDNLKVVVRAVYQDDVVRGPDGFPLETPDRFINQNVPVPRQPAGFRNVPVVDLPLFADALTTGEARWRYTPASDTLPDNTPLRFSLTPAQSGLVGWDIEASGFSAITKLIDDSIDVSWRFEDETGNPTIPFNPMVNSDGRMRLSIQFLGEDLAGNVTALDDIPSLGIRKGVLDPLNIWWIITTQARLRPNRSDSTLLIQDASFTFDVERNYSVPVVGQPEPLFTYRLFRSDTQGNDAAAAQGPYEAVPFMAGGFAEWSPLRRLNPGFFQSISSEIAGYFCILVIAVTDEAGNVSPWPFNQLTLVPGGGPNGLDRLILNTNASSGPEWQRFYISGAQAPDTAINARFWWNRVDAGNLRGIDAGLNEQLVAEDANLVPSPEAGMRQVMRVEGAFTISAIGDPATFPTPHFRWQISREGNPNSIVGGELHPTAGARRATVVLPQDLFVPAGNPNLSNVTGNLNQLLSIEPVTGQRRLEDAFKPVVYVFQAVSVSSSGEVDPSPANFAFTIVPTSNVGTYIDPKDRPEDQPIKVTEPR